MAKAPLDSFEARAWQADREEESLPEWILSCQEKCRIGQRSKRINKEDEMSESRALNIVNACQAAMTALGYDDADSLRQIMEEFPEIKAIGCDDGHGNKLTLIQWASILLKVKSLACLARAGCDIHEAFHSAQSISPDPDNTPLAGAIMSQSPIARRAMFDSLMLSPSADAKRDGAGWWWAMHAAVYVGDAYIMSSLRARLGEAGKPLWATPSSQHGNTLFHLAAGEGGLESLHLLLDWDELQGLAEQPNGLGMSPRQFAELCKNYKFCEELDAILTSRREVEELSALVEVRPSVKAALGRRI